MIVRRLALAVPALALLLTGCAGQSPDTAPTAEAPRSAAPPAEMTAPAEAPAGSPAPAEASPPATSAPARPADAQVIAVAVAGGEASGDTGRPAVKLGEPVRLAVTADVADEVHVHGYDLTQDVAPGAPATLEFIADRPGIFEVELEESGLLLTRLQVQ